MTLGEKHISDKIDHLFRHEYGKLVSVLTRKFGSSNLALAEDVVQEAMLEALNQWSYDGVPKNSVGWIYKVANNKALNILNREKYLRKYRTQTVEESVSSERDLSEVFTADQIADDQLRMIFTCCHPSITPDSQVALTLKTLCGFSISEIARAFLTSEENINKRLVRARKAIKVAEVAFEVPEGIELQDRLSSVLECIYLLFNEGYQATSGESFIRYELCEEAIRLAEIIASHQRIKSSKIFALLALMTLNASRFQSRIQQGHLLDLAHQDRKQWDTDLIKKGLYYLEFATVQKEVSNYHILAAISAQHCTASTYESTDWENILSLYNRLVDLDGSPVVLLNRIVVVSKVANAKEALSQLDKIKHHSIFRSYLPYYTTRAMLHYQNYELEKAKTTLKIALTLPLSNNDKTLISNMLADIDKDS